MPKVALIVDDEPANIDLLKGIIPSHFKVKAVLAGDKALKLVEKSPPDIIFLDLLMPGMDGYETLSAMQKINNFDVPVIIISGNASDEDKAKSKQAGAIAHLQKPVAPNTLIDLINDLTD